MFKSNLINWSTDRTPVMTYNNFIHDFMLCDILLDRLQKKSWFGALMGTDKEEHHFFMVRDKQLSHIKADLVHAFLCVSICSFSIMGNETG